MSDIDDNPTIARQLDSMFEGRDASGQVEAIKQLFNPKDVKMKSEVNKKLSEAEYFAKIFVLADLLKVKSLKTYGIEVLTTRVSNERLGRKEAVQMTQFNQPQEKSKGLFSWFR